MADRNPPKVSSRDAGPASEANELVSLLWRYVLQETTGPLKSLGRVLGFGSAAALMFGIGGVLGLIGLLRVLETETGSWFTGSLTWVPYVLTLVAGCIVIALAATVLLRSPKPSRTEALEGK
jgi:hypothetical protein